MLFSSIILLLLIGLMIISIRERQFLLGIILGFMTLCISIVAFFQVLIRISDYGEAAGLFVLLFVYGFIPLVFLAACIWLIYNSRVMHTKEGKSFSAKLSLLLGINLIIVIPTFLYHISVSVNMPYWLSFVIIFICLVDIVFTFTFIAYLLYSFLYQIIPVRKTVNYIIILGAGVRSEEVTPLLRSRLDKALAYQEKQKEKIKFVVSGGQGPDEPVSEAFAMRKYLLSQGVDEAQIIFEDESTTTLENMKFSKRKIAEDWKDETKEPVILFSTSNYHVLRGGMYARKAKVKAEGIGAPVAFYFLPTALIREFIAILVHYKVLTALVAIGLFLLLLLTFLPIGTLVTNS